MKNQPTPTTYSEARDVLGTRDGLKIAHNTQLERLDVESGAAVIGVRLHATYVVRFYGSDALRLDSGGWRTVTTKQRINRYLPAGVSLAQKGGVWRVTDRRFGSEVVVDFSDGMLLRPDSAITA